MNIIFIIKIPPPITGVTLINEFISKINFSIFKPYYIKISYKNSFINKNILKKYYILFMIIFLIFKYKITKKIKYAYFQISPIGLAFIRDLTIVFLLKLLNIRIIYHLHGKGISETCENSAILKFLYKWAFKNSSVICLSNALATDISQVYNGKPYIVNNGIPDIGYSYKPISNSNVPLNILFLSNLIYSKGILVLLDTLTLLDENYHNKIKVNIVGSEAELTESELNNEISKRNITHFVKYLGPKYGDEKNKIYQNTDILVYPTLNDAFPLVILEAMQFGIPVIASIEGAIPEIVDDGLTGFLVEKNEPYLIAEKIINLIEDRNLIEKMGHTARKKYLKYYTLDTFEQNMLTTFTDILNKNNELH